MPCSGPQADVLTTSQGHTLAQAVVPPGRHALLDAEGCDRSTLNDASTLRSIVVDAVQRAGVQLLHLHVASFEPCGVTAVAVLAESHVSVHTWPELGYAAIDAFTCGDKDPEALCLRIAQGLGAASTSARCLARRQQQARAGQEAEANP